jgi:hypothetical protein
MRNLTNDERHLLTAIRESAKEFGTLVDSQRKVIQSRHGLTDRQAVLAVAVALGVSTAFAARLAKRGSFDDCRDLDQIILDFIEKSKGTNDASER